MRNRPAFLKYSNVILGDRRSWDGPGMHVNVQLLKNRLRELIARHDAETLPAIPAFRNTQETN